ncbi:heme exporter protein CcmB [Sphingobium sufflavum]|uniref:heme exporter protein CcmB n=1 Tax=Sphingobium sufflavum TaxID=1129547 RepID=UPI001F215137|nr:heme exporter protein CcmB [Sphingobium sufflavum]MCE7798786.1 heme exporter protein CcmB [Sphingobium sufflavum]
MIAAIIRRDCARSWTGGSVVIPVIFVLMVATLIPFALGPRPTLLSATGGGMLWVAALLASLLPIDRLIEPDRESGLFDQLILRGARDETIIAAKLVAHWLNFGPPLLLACLPAAALLQLPGEVLLRLEISLLIGTPGLAALALLTATLTAGLRGSSALAGLLVLPLAVPLLIFGAGALGANSGSALKLLAASALILVAIAPFAGGAALRAGRE